MRKHLKALHSHVRKHATNMVNKLKKHFMFFVVILLVVGIPSIIVLIKNKDNLNIEFTFAEDYGYGYTVEVCGNNIIEGTEQCDDGNTDSGDGCSSTCTIELRSFVEGYEGLTWPGQGLSNPVDNVYWKLLILNKGKPYKFYLRYENDGSAPTTSESYVVTQFGKLKAIVGLDVGEIGTVMMNVVPYKTYHNQFVVE